MLHEYVRLDVHHQMLFVTNDFSVHHATTAAGGMGVNPRTNPVESDPLTSTRPFNFGDPLTFCSRLPPAGSTHAEHKLSYRPPK